MIKSSHRPCTLMKVDNHLTLVHFLHKSLEKMLMYDTALFLCPQQWRGKIFQLSHRFLFNYSLWQSILASLSSFQSMNDLRSILIKLIILGYSNIIRLCFSQESWAYFMLQIWATKKENLNLDQWSTLKSA